MSRTAYIAMGSNLGDRVGHILDALELLNQHPDIEVARVSALFDTAPMYVLDQPAFVNGCARVLTRLSPHGLLAEMLRVETALGRVREIDKGPRTIDLDLLFFDGEVLATPELDLPHPGIAERAFVLEPLATIAPELTHPITGVSVQQMLDVCAGRDSVVWLSAARDLGEEALTDGPVDVEEVGDGRADVGERGACPE